MNLHEWTMSVMRVVKGRVMKTMGIQGGVAMTTEPSAGAE